MNWFSRFTPALLALGLAISPVQSATGLSDNVHKTTFSNGLRVLVKPEPGSGLVAISVIIRAGALEEEHAPGLGQVLSRTLFTGARNLSGRKLAELSDEVGGSFAVTWDLDFTEVYIATTRDQLRPALEILSEILLHPRFDPAIVESARQEVTSQITSAREAAFRASYDELRRLLYLDSPYRRALLGSTRAVEGITPADLEKFVADWFVPSNMVIAVVGDVSVEETLAASRLWFSSKPAVSTPTRNIPRKEPGLSRPPSLLEIETRASYVVAGTLASGMGDAEYGADMVVATVLGGGKASRMFQELREKRGLAYELGTLYPPLVYQSHLVAYVLAAPYEAVGRGLTLPTLEAIRAGLNETVLSLRETPITEAELIRAKRYLIGRFILRHQRLNERARHLAWYESLGLGFGFDAKYPQIIESVTLEQAQKSAERLFRHSSMVLVVPKE